MARKKREARDSIVEEARQRLEYAQEMWGPIYKASREDLRFSDPTDPQQWPDDVKRERQMAAGGARPTLVFDQTRQFVRQVINGARRNKPAINYLPVDEKSDPKLAEVLKGLARQVEYQSRADTAYITALDQAVRGGIGYFRAYLDDVKDSEIEGQKCVKVGRVVDFESVYPDPDFTELDGSDMGWAIVEEMVPRPRFEKQNPGAKTVDFDDRGWFSKDHVRVADYYRIVEVEGKRVCEHYRLSGEEVLDKTIFPGEFVPVFPVIGNEEWDEGKRRLSGCIRLARDSQISYNFERNSEFEAVAVGPKAPWLAPAESIADYEDHWKQANRGNLAYLPYKSVDVDGKPLPFKPERISPAGIASGWTQLSERSKQDIQASLGFYEASAGNNPNQQSGRAVIALQDKADIGTFHYVDNLALTISHLGRVLTQVWPVIYDQEQIVRIIGEDDDPQFVRVNPEQPVGYTESVDLNGKPVVSVNPGVGRYDVRATVGPAYQTRQAEAAAELGEFVNGNPQLMALFGDVYVKMRNYPDQEKLARRFQAMLPPQIQQAENGQTPLPPEVQNVLQQAQQEIQQLRGALQEAQSGMAAEQLKAQVQMQVAQLEAQNAVVLEQVRADAAHDREELRGLIELLKQQIQPPPVLASEVAGNIPN